MLREATRVLQTAEVPSPRVDAEILLAHVVGVARPEVVRRALLGQPLDEAEHTAYLGLVDERAARVPLQHLTGAASFAGLDLAVGPGVFVPRPETETLVELAVEAATGLDDAMVVDLCSGSGAIALAVKHRVPSAQVVGVEVSPEAHAWALHNALRTGLDVEMRQGDARAAGEELLGRVDLVTCNPPYIPLGAVPVDPEVRDHDPQVALYGGSDDGLHLPIAMAARASQLLRPGGVLLVEHADTQGETLPAALDAQRVWREVTDHADLTGRPRVTRAVRR
ncbi:MAG: peptide chain release factor N(5)-glutamine methyltransferase [Ornithinimicrobium sp.]|uniref:peptide chain release factor N(5)-glutamine methyltransferase n=1 Tax=Ornithinimicrobium sp. TaxID=1977084 RepID=UPI003D9AC7B4